MARKDFVRINGFDDKVSQIGLFCDRFIYASEQGITVRRSW